MGVIEDTYLEEFYIQDLINNIKFKELKQIDQIKSEVNKETKSNQNINIYNIHQTPNFIDNPNIAKEYQTSYQLRQNNINACDYLKLSHDINQTNKLDERSVDKYELKYNHNFNQLNNIDSNFTNTNLINDFSNLLKGIKIIDFNFISKHILNNKFNSFNQLHRDELKDIPIISQLINLDQIKICNFSENPLFIRISGQQNKQSCDELKLKDSKIWNVSKNSIYNVEIKQTKNLDGVCYNLKSGVIYHIDEKNNLTDAGNNTLLSNSYKFEPLFELKNKLGVFYLKDDKSMLVLLKITMKVLFL